MSRTGGFKEQHTVGLEQELRKSKRLQRRSGQLFSAGPGRIKPSVRAVAVCLVPGLFGGRSLSITNEHATGGSDGGQ